MLSQEERAEIEADLAHYPNKRAACIEAMKVVQRHRRWVSDESIKDIAELLEMSPTELDGVATFFNQIYRRPVGRNVVLMCNSVTCFMLGQPALERQFSKCLGVGPGMTTTDDEFTVIPTQCLGCCDHAPAVMVNDDLHHDVDPGQIDGLIARYRKA